MVSLSPEQQEILGAVRQEVKNADGTINVHNLSVMKKHDLVQAVCRRIQVNGCETALKVYDVLRMLELREVQL